MRAILLSAILVVSSPGVAMAAKSVLPTAPDDPRAITVKGVGDGRADDTQAVQQAIDAARDKTGHGVVFLPSGRYRLTRSILVPPGVRVFGVGATRPVFVLAANTPGFQQGVGTMIVFTGGDQYQVGEVPVPGADRPCRATLKVRDANSGTFYSAMSNVDIEIGEGNPAAAAVRFRMAQHAFLSHMEFRHRLGLRRRLPGRQRHAEDVHFQGGRYGIVTEKTSPAWQFTLLDSTFDGQRDAAIREHEVDLTLVNVAIANTPVGIEIDRGYGDWPVGQGRPVRERLQGAASSSPTEDNVFTQVGLRERRWPPTPRCSPASATAARPWPGKGRAYKVASFTYGLTLPGLGQMGEYKTTVDRSDAAAGLPARRAPAIRALPPIADWVNVKTLGVKGDSASDDTAALQKAIDTHRVLYLPTGFYKVTDTLKLRPDTVLIGLHPALTQLVHSRRQSGAIAGVGPVKPVAARRPRAATTSCSGWACSRAGSIRARRPCCGARARASQVDGREDHGRRRHADHGRQAAGRGSAPRSGDPVADGRWDAQYPSIWVTDGGGGTFANVWSPNTFASAGLYVSDTSTPGHIYQVSVEHHVRNEFVLDNVENWEFLAPQTEQEVGDGPDAVSLEVRNSRNILFANYHGYRVTRSLPSGRDGGEAVQLDGHPLPQRARERRERHRDAATRTAAGPILRARQVSVRERDPGRDHASWRCASASSPCSM